MDEAAQFVYNHAISTCFMIRSTETSRLPPPDIAGILATIEAMFGVTITLHDPAGIFTGAGHPPLPDIQAHHRHPFCHADRFRRSSYDRLCLQHCLREVEAQAGGGRDCFVHRCWKGASEIVIPVYIGNTHAATIFVGVFRGGRSPAGIDNRSLPTLTPELTQRIVLLLRAGVYGVIHEQGIGLPPRDRRERILHYLGLNAHRQPTLGELAQELKLSPSRASHAVRELCGCNFQTLLNRVRLERARDQLRNTDHTIERIAIGLGYRSGVYLHRLFRKEMNLTPNEFRRMQKKPSKKISDK